MPNENEPLVQDPATAEHMAYAEKPYRELQVHAQELGVDHVADQMDLQAAEAARAIVEGHTPAVQAPETGTINPEPFTNSEVVSSPEKEKAVESIASNPATSVGIDYWDGGAAYSELSRYKIKHLSDETRDSEKLREDFNLILRMNQDELRDTLPENPQSVVCKLENEDGVTYKLMMRSPKAVRDDRPNVDMIVSIPATSSLQHEISLIDADPSMLLDLFRAFGQDKSIKGRYTLDEMADDVKIPVLLSREQTAAAFEAINNRKKNSYSTYEIKDRDLVQPLHPAPSPVQAIPVPQKRRFGRRHG